MTKLSDLHFVEFDMGEDRAELRPALVTAVHAFNSQNDNALGLDFQGQQARVFASLPQLAAFCAQPRIRRLGGMCAAVKGPQPVPAVTQGVQLLRQRSATRQQPARIRRFEQRNPGATWQHQAPIRCDLAIPLASHSTEQAFLLKLVRRPAPLQDTVAFNSYGLCLNGTAVPMF